MKQKLYDLLMSCGRCDKFDEYVGCRKCEYDCSDEDCEKHLANIMADDMLKAGVVVLPVKPNDTVYIINHGRIKEHKVYFAGINSRGEVKFTVADEDFHNTYEFWDDNIGVCVFLTEEDAINELKERKSYDCT